jgi:tRNA 2-thiouridine synthesizing protein A
MAASKPNMTLDCIGLHCPVPVIQTREAIDKLAVGEVIELLADDPAAEADMTAWAKRTGQKILKIEKAEPGLRFLIQKVK